MYSPDSVCWGGRRNQHMLPCLINSLFLWLLCLPSSWVNGIGLHIHFYLIFFLNPGHTMSLSWSKLSILLHQPFKCYDYRLVSLYYDYVSFVFVCSSPTWFVNAPALSCVICHTDRNVQILMSVCVFYICKELIEGKEILSCCYPFLFPKSSCSIYFPSVL